MWTNFMTWLTTRVARDEEGQGLVEYALILFLVSILVIGTLTIIGQNVDQIFGDIGAAL